MSPMSMLSSRPRVGGSFKARSSSLSPRTVPPSGTAGANPSLSNFPLPLQRRAGTRVSAASATGAEDNGPAGLGQDPSSGFIPERFEGREQLFRDWELQRGRLQSRASPRRLWGPALLLPCGVIAAAAAGMLSPETFSQAPVELYAPAMGFLSFVIALDFRLKHFLKAASQTKDILVGAICHWMVVPSIGAAVAATVVPSMQLPQSLGLGIMMASFLPVSVMSCWATWVAHPVIAPLSVVLATTSMLLCSVATPLLGAQLPAAVLPGASSPLASVTLDPKAMALATAQMIVIPTAAGLILGKVAEPLVKAIKPILSFLALAVVCCCTGVAASASAPILNYPWATSAFVPILVMQLGSMFVSYYIARSALNSIARAKCISLSAGMPAALLGTFVLDRFAKDSIAALGCSLYIPVMLLAGLGMAQWWRPAQR